MNAADSIYFPLYYQSASSSAEFASPTRRGKVYGSPGSLFIHSDLSVSLFYGMCSNIATFTITFTITQRPQYKYL